MSRSTVSRICDAISGEFTAWSARSLADVELDDLYLDGTHFRYHPGARAEPVLVAYGITATGSPVFLGLTPAGGEGHDPWSTSWMNWPRVGCGHRCWSSATARLGSSPPSSRPSRLRCANAV